MADIVRPPARRAAFRIGGTSREAAAMLAMRTIWTGSSRVAKEGPAGAALSRPKRRHGEGAYVKSVFRLDKKEQMENNKGVGMESPMLV